MVAPALGPDPRLVAAAAPPPRRGRTARRRPRRARRRRARPMPERCPTAPRRPTPSPSSSAHPSPPAISPPSSRDSRTPLPHNAFGPTSHAEADDASGPVLASSSRPICSPLASSPTSRGERRRRRHPAPAPARRTSGRRSSSTSSWSATSAERARWCRRPHAAGGTAYLASSATRSTTHRRYAAERAPPLRDPCRAGPVGGRGATVTFRAAMSRRSRRGRGASRHRAGARGEPRRAAPLHGLRARARRGDDTQQRRRRAVGHGWGADARGAARPWRHRCRRGRDAVVRGHAARDGRPHPGLR